MKLTGQFNGRFNTQYFFLEGERVKPGSYYLHANYGDFDLWGGYDLEMPYVDYCKHYRLVNSQDYNAFPKEQDSNIYYSVYLTKDGKHFEFLRYSGLPNAESNTEFDKFVAS